MKAGEVMSAPVVQAQVDTPMVDVAALLTAHRISAVPVVDGSGQVVGLVSEYDLLARAGSTARDIMSSDVVSVTVDTDIESVRHLLIERRIKRVPVMDGGRLVGIVSRGDLIGLMVLEWACEVCGEPVRGDHPPQRCSKCGTSEGRFTQQAPPPGG